MDDPVYSPRQFQNNHDKKVLSQRIHAQVDSYSDKGPSNINGNNVNQIMQEANMVSKAQFLEVSANLLEKEEALLKREGELRICQNEIESLREEYLKVS